MNFRGKLLSALAWVGLVIVIAVPSADMLRSKLMVGGPSGTRAVPTKSLASVVIAEPGKADAPAVASATPVVPAMPKLTPIGTAVPTPAVKPTVPVATDASVTPENSTNTSPGDPVKDYLASGKALPNYIKQAAPGAAPPPAAVAPVAAPPPVQAPAVVIAKPAPIPPTVAVAPPQPKPARPKAVVTEADLKDWKSGTLEDYLRAHGLLTQSADPSGN
jgi:hypothetical protein